MASVKLTGLDKSYGAAAILRDISLTVEDGELLVLVGPSGCGKSTLLRLIAGLDGPSSGEIHIGARNVTHLEPAQRKIAMVFQSYALYPHMNVRQNMIFGLKFQGMSAEEMRRRVSQAARMLQLEALLDRRPRELSGGQRQRVAIGRAIVREPDVFLFDEPLSNLDAALRVSTRVEIAKLHRALRATMIYVTHDQTEAMTLADRIVVMNQGRIAQIGRPLDLYYAPANLFVARFIGSPGMNIFAARITQKSAIGIRLEGQGIPAFDLAGQDIAAPAGALVSLGVRPEHLSREARGAFQLAAPVELVERLGETSYVYLSGEGGPIIAEIRGRAAPQVGDNIRLGASAADLHLFDAAGDRLTLR